MNLQPWIAVMSCNVIFGDINISWFLVRSGWFPRLFQLEQVMYEQYF